MNTREYEDVVLEYQKPIFNYLKRFLGDSDEALDCSQETFIKLYKHKDTVDPSKNLKSWLYKVATNTALDYLRKRKRLNEISFDEEIETNTPDVTYNSQELEVLKNDIEKALNSIPENFRAILVLYYKEDFTYQEISEFLELPINTVKTHIRRAKFALKEHLKNYG